jgi:hypothetical protein
MPGAPNKPPESAPVAPPPSETPEQGALRRLAPSRVALRLPIWKGAPSPDLLRPYSEADALFHAGDLPGAGAALDRLAVRFAEPRWPSLPDPFRQLRVPTPAPQPPHWDPDHALSPADRELARARRRAEAQVALARGSLDAEAARGTSVDDLRPLLEEADAARRTGALDASVWGPIDRIWRALLERVPAPAPAPRAGPPPPPAETEPAGA